MTIIREEVYFFCLWLIHATPHWSVSSPCIYPYLQRIGVCIASSAAALAPVIGPRAVTGVSREGLDFTHKLQPGTLPPLVSFVDVISVAATVGASEKQSASPVSRRNKILKHDAFWRNGVGTEGPIHLWEKKLTSFWRVDISLNLIGPCD